MSFVFSPKIVTASALVAGDVIYLTEFDTWSRDHRQAELIDDEAHGQLRLLFAEAQGEVVGAYLANVKPGASGPEPTHFRDVFRAAGPSNYHHGKQEKLRNV